MKEVQASAAKARFSELLDQVEHQGETIVITRHGKVVARLVPDDISRRENIRKAMDEIREMRRRMPRVTAEEILSWRDEGRK